MRNTYFNKMKLVLFFTFLCSTELLLAADLLTVYELAQKNDHQYKAASAQYKADAEFKNIERAGLLPTLNGDVSWQELRNTTNVSGEFVSDVGSQAQVGTNETIEDSDFTSYTLTLSQPLFNMRAWNNYKSGKAQTAAAEAEFNRQQQSLILRSAEAFFNALLAVANFETSVDEEKALLIQLKQSKQRYDAGLNAITEVHEAQASYDSAVANRHSANGQLAIEFEALEVLTREPSLSVAPLLSGFPLEKPMPASQAEWVEKALANSTTLESSKADANSAEYQAKAERSDHLPTLSFNARYADQSGIQNNFGLQSDFGIDSYRIDLTLQVPLFNGGATSAERRRANQLAIASRETYLQTRLTTIQGTRSAYIEVISGLAATNARKQTIASRQSALDATEAGYRLGTRNFIDVLNAQRGLYDARRSYDTALYGYILNSLRLKNVAGILAEQDLHAINTWLDLDNHIHKP